jgi:hypothetical protein
MSQSHGLFHLGRRPIDSVHAVKPIHSILHISLARLGFYYITSAPPISTAALVLPGLGLPLLRRKGTSRGSPSRGWANR